MSTESDMLVSIIPPAAMPGDSLNAVDAIAAPSILAASPEPTLAERVSNALREARRDASTRELHRQLHEQLLERARRENDGLLLAAALQLQYTADSQWIHDCHAVADILAVTSGPERAAFLRACGVLPSVPAEIQP